MAIFHSHAGVITRSKRKSAIAASSYINGDKYYNERQGMVHDYSKKERVLCKGVLAPEEAPDWVYDKEKLWNNVDKFEDNLALKRFGANYKDEEKNRKSLIGREEYLSSCQTAQTLECALPVELDLATCKKIVKEYLSERFVSRGLVVDYAIHYEGGNPHFHALITRRPVGELGFSNKKDQEILSKSSIKESRKLYADKVNKYLELAGIDARIDHRSYKDQGIDLVASRHKGWQASDLAKRGEYSRIVDENESIRQENIEILFNRPSQLIELVASKKSVFTSDDIAKEVLKRVGGDERLFSMLSEKLEQSNVLEEMQVSGKDYSVYEGFKGNIIEEMQEKVEEYAGRLLVESREVEYIGRSIADKLSYTSKEYNKLEKRIFSALERVNCIGGKGVDRGIVESQISLKEESLSNKLGQSAKLSEEQREAIIHLTSDRGLSFLEGRAGSGKTTILETVAKSYEESGYKVMGTSFQGKVTEIMEEEIGVPAWTLDYLRVRWDKYRGLKSDIEQGKLTGKGLRYAKASINKLEKYQLTKETVVLVDEANMIGINLWKYLSKEVSESGAKLIIVQDRAQLKPVHIGDVARGLVEKYKDNVYELRSVYRQQVAWQREASILLNDHNVIDGLKPYTEHKVISWHNNQLSACRSLVNDYISDKQNSSEDRLLIMSFLNSKVNLLNRMVHDELKQSGYLSGEGINIGGKEYLLGERIVFTQNDNYGIYVSNIIGNNKYKIREQRVGVKNGSFGIIKEISNSSYKAEIIVEIEDKRLVSFNPKKFDKFDYGYGITINKAEGTTVDRSYVLLDNKMTANLTLIAMTRHREEVKCYVSEEEFTDNKDLAEKLSKRDYKPLVEDYSISDISKPYYDMVKEYKEGNIAVGNIIQEIIDELPADKEIYEHRYYKKFEEIREKRDSLAKEIIGNWSECNKFTLQAGIKKNTVEYHAGLRQRELSDLEKKAAVTTEIYLAAHEKASNLWQEIKSTHPGYLAKEHEKYSEYLELKRERDSIAYVIAEDKNLYRPFFRTRSQEKEVDGNLQKVRVNYFGEEIKYQPRLADVVKQGEAHLVNETSRSVYARLSSEKKVHYDLVKSYSKSRNMVASYIGSLKEVAVSLDSTDHNVIKFKSTDVYEGLKQARLDRNKTALVIANDIDKYAPYFSLFKVKEEKLLEHATIEERASKEVSKEANTNRVIDIKERGYRSYESYIENRYSNYNILELKEAVSNRLPELAVTLLGGCNNHLSTKEELRFGSKGSIAVSLSGSKQGLWYDFSEGRGGDVFSLVSREKGVSYQDALEYVASMVGINPENKVYDLSKYRKNVRENIEISILEAKAKAADKSTNKIKKVNRLYESSVSIEGTPAESYLREHRGIELELSNHSSIRYIEEAYEPESKGYLPALLAVSRDSDHQLKCAQVTYLDRDIGKKANIKVGKRSYGTLKGSLVEISKSEDVNNIYIIAEGIETALSISESGIDGNIYASLGISNMESIIDYLNVALEVNNKESVEIVIAADNDGANAVSLKTLEKVQAHLKAEGYQVKVVMPAKEKSDFNDLLKAEGKESVKAVISEALQKLEAKEIGQDIIQQAGIEAVKSKDIKLSDQEFELMKYKYIAGIRLINRFEDRKESIGYLLTNIYGKERKEEARSKWNSLVKEEGIEKALSKIKDNSRLLGKLAGKRDWLLAEDERRKSAKEFSKRLYDRLKDHYNYLDKRKEAQQETKEIYGKISYCNTAGKDYGELVEEYKLVTTRLREVDRGFRIAQEYYSEKAEAEYVEMISENMARLTLLNRDINNKEPSQKEIMDYREMASHKSRKPYVDPKNLEETLKREISDSREQWLKMRVALNHYHKYKEINVLHASKYIKSQMAEEEKLTTSINEPFKLSEEKNRILYREMTGRVGNEEVISRITEKQHELMKEILPHDAKSIERDYLEYRLAEGLIKRELLGENIKVNIAKIMALEIERDLKEIKKMREIEIAKEMQLQKERIMGIER